MRDACPTSRGRRAAPGLRAQSRPRDRAAQDDPLAEGEAPGFARRDTMSEAVRPRRALYIVVPVFNEAPNLERLFHGLRATAREVADLDVAVLLVDDGSTDETPELARGLGAEIDLTVLTHETNRGPDMRSERHLLSSRPGSDRTTSSSLWKGTTHLWHRADR